MREVEFRDIEGYRYEVSSDLFQSGDNYPPNNCTCNDGVCLGDGFTDLTPCWGVPVIVSQPHFYNADPEETAKFEGFEPNHEKHTIYFEIEPVSEGDSIVRIAIITVV